MPTVVSNPQAQLTIGANFGGATILAKAADSGTDGMSPDGFTWAQAPTVYVDPWGKLITCVQQNTGKVNHWMYSNDGGVTWTVNTSQIDTAQLLRASLATDTTSGTWLHALWNAQASTDGILYRRYAITRDGSHNITALSAARDVNVNLQLDFQASGTIDYELPVLVWIPEGGANGSLLAIWPIHVAGVGAEVRASMRNLSLDAADSTGSNWKAPSGASSTVVGNAPTVPYTAVFAVAAAVSAVGVSAARKATGTNQKDVGVVYTNGASPGSVFYRRLRWNAGSNDWSTGLSTAVTLTSLQRAGADSLGYTLKYQLLSQPRWDGGGNLGVYETTYKDNANRDTATLILLPDAESGPVLVDAYSAGTHQDFTTKFVTGDVSYDSGLGRWVVAYTDLPAKAIWVAAYDGSGSVQQAATQIYSARPVDIPTLANGRIKQGTQDRLLLFTRDFNATAASADTVAPTYTPPYTGIYLTLDFAAPATAGKSGTGVSLVGII